MVELERESANYLIIVDAFNKKLNNSKVHINNRNISWYYSIVPVMIILVYF